MKRNIIILTASLLMIGGAFALATAGGDSRAGAMATAPGAAAGAEDTIINTAATELSDKALAKYQLDLLDLAFDTATAIPAEPHINDRSKAQEATVSASLELLQPSRSFSYVKQMSGWRQGAAYADLAYFQVRQTNSITPEISEYLQQAERTAAMELDWRRDRIRVKIAMSHVWVGQNERAGEFENGVVDSESGKVDVVRAIKTNDETFDDQIVALDDLLAAGDLDRVKNALHAYIVLLDRFYSDDQKRSSIEKTVQTSWSGLPIVLRLNLMMDMVACAVRHDDKANAIKLADETQSILASYQWSVEDQVPLTARLAELRYQAGDVDNARRMVDEAMTLYESRLETLYDFDRSEILRSLAEALQAMGDSATARKTYERAIEAGAANSNARIRALMLSAVCRSLALHEVEPDAELWTRLRSIREGLAHPW